MQEKRDANANVTWRAWFVIDRAVMAYKETETDVLYGVTEKRYTERKHAANYVTPISIFSLLTIENYINSLFY
jgi:poly-D-alanine transfer protein DltD